MVDALNAQRLPLRWLKSPGSLTRRLRRACVGDLRIHILSEHWRRADITQARVLGVRHGVRIWQREVELRCAVQVYVHALSFVTARGRCALALHRLGGRPLAQVLFSRSARRVQGGIVRRFSLPQAHSRPRRWAVYAVRGHRVLLFEDFLPALTHQY